MVDQFQQEEQPSFHVVPLTFTSAGKLSQIPVPLVRLWTCGMLKLDVLTAVSEDHPPHGSYQEVVSQDLRGRGAIPALMLLKRLVSSPHRFATCDTLITHLSEEQERGTVVHLDVTASYLRGLLCRVTDQQERLRLLLVEHLRNGRGSGPGYRLAPYPLLWLDTDALAFHVEHASLCERMGEPELAYPLWQRAYALASRGDYLPDEPHSEWAKEQREQVQGYLRQSVHALARLTQVFHGQAGEEEAEHLLRSYWLVHQTDEDALRALMELLGKRERFGEAEQYYQQCVEALEEEYGRPPTKQTEEMHAFLRLKHLSRASQPVVARLGQAGDVHASALFVPSLPHVIQLPQTQLALFPETLLRSRPSLQPSERRSHVSPPLLEQTLTVVAGEASDDCALWFSNQLALIIAFITQVQNQMDVIHFQRLLDRELRVFDQIKALFDPDTYFLSRRSALLVIAAMPSGLLGLLQRSKASFIEEEFLPACAASLTACWYLLNGREFASVERILSRFMPLLFQWAHAPSTYQKSAACLASQGDLLLSLVASHRLQLHQRVAACEEAVIYARGAEDHLLLIKALTMLGNALYDQERYVGMLHAYQEAKYLSDQASETLPRILLCKVLMGLAHAHAQQSQAKEALDTITRARAIFPTEIEELPSYLSADDGLFSLILFEGWVRLDLGKQDANKGYFEQAAQALAAVESLPETMLIPERIRIEIANRRAQAAMAQGDLDAFLAHTLQSTEGLQVIQSEKRRQEVVSNYREARKKWPNERQIGELADVLLSLSAHS